MTLSTKKGGALRQLPTSNTDANGSFYALLAPYGIATGINSGSVTGTGTDGKSYNIAEAPLYFVRSGWVTSASLKEPGASSAEWSSRTNSDARYAYHFYTNASSLSPSNAANRYHAVPLRCLARQ